MEVQEDWDCPYPYEDFDEELVNLTGTGDPDTVEENGRKVKKLDLISNFGSYDIKEIEEEEKALTFEVIHKETQEFIKDNEKHLTALRERYGDENVNVLYSAMLGYN